MTYDGFISYSHAVDGQLAPALQRGLQQLARPWNRRRSLHIFRDETGLATNPHLWSAIESALDDSEWFVLLASPEAAASEWVAKEVEHWVASKPLTRLLPVVTDGIWTWDVLCGDLSDDSTAVPPALRGVFTEEPRHLDLRWARALTDLDLRNSAFRDSVADLAAPMHGIPKDELEGEDVRLHRRARRLARAAIVGLATLAVAALLAAGLAVVNARAASRESDRAKSAANNAVLRGLTGQAVAQAATSPDRALLLATEAFHRDKGVQSQDALLRVLNRSARLDALVAQAGPLQVISGVSGDGSVIALSDSAGGVTLVDGHTRARKRTLRTGQSGEVAVFFSADGETVATTGEDGTVRLWDGASGRPRTAVLHAHTSPVHEAEFSPDGTMLATEDAVGSGFLWNVATGRAVAPLPKAIIVADGADLAFGGDGRSIALVGGQTSVYGLPALQRIVVAPIHGAKIDRAVAMSADGSTLAVSNGPGRVVELLAVTPGATPSRSLPVAPDDVVVRLAFSSDGSKLAAGMQDGSVLVWDPRAVTGEPVRVTGDEGAIRQLVFTAPNTLLASSRKRVIRWDLAHRSTIAIRKQLTEGPLVPLTRLAMRPDGREVAVSDLDGRVWFVDPRTLRLVAGPVATDPARVSRPELAYSPDGSFLVVGSAAGTLRYINASAHRLMRDPLPIVPPGPNLLDHGVIALTVSPDGKTVALVDTRGLTLVDVDGWRVRNRTVVPNAILSSVAYSPDGRSIVVGDNNGRVLRLSALDPDRVTVMVRVGSAVGGTEFSPGGRRLLVTSEADAKWIDLRRGPATSAAFVGSLAAFRPDGRYLATAQAGRWRLWDVGSEIQIGDPMVAHPFGETLVTGVGGLAFVPHQRALITAGADGSVVRWDLDAGSWVRHACAAANRNLTRAEWRRYVGALPYRKTCG